MIELFSRNSAPNRARRPALAQALVEFGFVALMLIGVMLAIIEGARWISTYFMLANAAAEGARVGTFTTSTDTQIRTATQSILAPAPWIVLDPNNDIAICRLPTAAASDNPCPSATATSGHCAPRDRSRA